MGTLYPELVHALNMLLEDERASVEIEVALANGATEYLEREALTAMGVEDTQISYLLREWLESLQFPVTRRINGIVLQALDLSRYDDRLMLFVRHQMEAREHAQELLSEGVFADDLVSEGGAILRSLVDAHTRHAAWCEERAREFAETRQLDFRRPLQRSPSDTAEGSDLLPETSGEHSSPRRSTPPVADPADEGASASDADDAY